MEERRPRIASALIVLVVIAGLIIWWVNSLPNEDPIWFLRVFNTPPDWITIYWDGATTMFFPGDPDYSAIYAAFADGVAHWSGYEDGVGLSDENLERFRKEWRLLELHYNDPVKVHTQHLYSEARIFYVPLTGTHAEMRRVFAGLTDRPRVGVINVDMNRYAALAEAVSQAAIP